MKIHTEAKAFRNRRFLELALVALVAVTVSGCTPEKAQAIKMAADQFRSHASEAVNAIEELMVVEIEPVPRTETQKNEEFVANILSLEPTETVNLEIMELAVDPYQVNLSSTELTSRDSFLNSIKGHYATFRDTFDDLDRGSFLARNKIDPTKKHAVKLIVQMAGLADEVGKNPPRMHQHRTAILSNVEKIRRDATLSAEQRRIKLIAAKEDWENLMARERTLQNTVVEKCLKAAISGKEVLRLIENYKKLSLEDIADISGRMVSASEMISGRDLSKLRSQSLVVINEIKNNPTYHAVINGVLTEVQNRNRK